MVLFSLADANAACRIIGDLAPFLPQNATQQKKLAGAWVSLHAATLWTFLDHYVTRSISLKSRVCDLCYLRADTKSCARGDARDLCWWRRVLL